MPTNINDTVPVGLDGCTMRSTLPMWIRVNLKIELQVRRHVKNHDPIGDVRTFRLCVPESHMFKFQAAPTETGREVTHTTQRLSTSYPLQFAVRDHRRPT